MKQSDKNGVQLLVNFLAGTEISEVVLSPGSRNAPISLSFFHHPHFNVKIIADERSAAYFALGITLQNKKPSVLVCTSGTAVLNYAPAIAEAFYQHVPMLVITADRPTEWIDQGDGQTIRQENIYANYCLKSFSIKGDSQSTEELNNVVAILNEALNLSLSKKGPVHINVTLEEPLYRLEDFVQEQISVRLEDAPVDFISNKHELLEIWKKSTNILVIAGQMPHHSELNDSLVKLAENDNLIVMTENTSNLFSDRFICCIDRTIDGFSEEEKETFKPDLLITIGGAVVSKKVKSWLRQHKPKFHWRIGREDEKMDTYRCLTHSLTVEAGFFIHEIANWKRNANGEFKKSWQDRNLKITKTHQDFIKHSDFSDLKVFSILLKNIPSNSNFHLGNSSPVRYAQLFDTRKDLMYHSNRGTSGIDGCTSTAAGMASVSDSCVTLISGDISFFYDSNALWNDYLKNLKIIVINNGGGGIFRIIDQPKEIKETELLFETRHNRSVEGIAKAFQVNYLSANDEISLEKALEQLYADQRPTVLEIFTPTEKNALILRQYFDKLKMN